MVLDHDEHYNVNVNYVPEWVGAFRYLKSTQKFHHGFMEHNFQPEFDCLDFLVPNSVFLLSKSKKGSCIYKLQSRHANCLILPLDLPHKLQLTLLHWSSRIN